MIAQELLYQQLEEQFADAGALVSPAELQGHLCGRHVVGHHLEGIFGLRIISDYIDLPVSDLEDLTEQLETLISSKVLVMNEDLFGFQLFLPDDEIALGQRLEHLSFWTQGFLSGLGSTAGDEEAKLMQEENETLQDLVEISRLDSDVEDTEENEALFVEVSEFVRLAAFNLFDEFRALNREQEEEIDKPN